MSDYRITGSPAEIWLVYGDIEQDTAHAECGDVTWCEDQVYGSDVRYMRADSLAADLAALRRDAERWRKVERLVSNRWDGTIGRPSTWWLRVSGVDGKTFGDVIDAGRN